MTKKIARFYDYITVAKPSGLRVPEDSKEKVKFIDSYLTNQKHLVVTVKATHAARLTRNNGFYLPEKMRKGAKTMLSKAGGGTEDYNKPVLLNHDADKDPLGRILTADYVDLSQNFKGTDSYRDLLLGLARTDHVWRAVDLVESLYKTGVLFNRDWEGLGYIKSSAKITDQDAIVKILDERYATVSTGMSSDKAVCSVCHEDWVAEGSPCDHRPGKVYDDKQCFLIAGDMYYDEWSFVNRPADSAAVTVEARLVDLVNDTGSIAIDSLALNDSYKEDIFVSFSDSEGTKVTIDKQSILAQLTEGLGKIEEDKVLRTDLSKLEDSEVEKKVNSILSTNALLDKVILGKIEMTDALALDGNGSHLERQMLIEMHDSMHARYDWRLGDESNEYAGISTIPASVFHLHSKLMSLADEQSFRDELVNGKLDLINLNGEDEPIETGMGRMVRKPVDSVQDLTFDSIDLAKEELSLEEVSLLNSLVEDRVAAILLSNDAVLTSAQRKRLASSTFCGPNESYPVPDRAHAINALARAKQFASSALYAQIKNCVCRKFAGLPACGGTGDSADSAWTPELITEAAEKEAIIMGWKEETKDAAQETAETSLSSLPNTAFAGPGRTFPAHDFVYIRASYEVLNTYKGTADVTKLKEVLDQKAKAIGYEYKAEDAEVEENQNVLTDTIANMLQLSNDDIKKLATITNEHLSERGLVEQIVLVTDAKLEDQLKWLRQELKDIYADYDLQGKALEAATLRERDLLTNYNSVVDHIKDPAVSYADLLKVKAEMKIDVLRKEYTDLHQQVDFDKIILETDKDTNGTSGNKPEPIEDPTVSADSQQTKESSVTIEDDKWTKTVINKFKEIRDSEGSSAARKYLATAKTAKLIPTSFDISKHLEDN